MNKKKITIIISAVILVAVIGIVIYKFSTNNKITEDKKVLSENSETENSNKDNEEVQSETAEQPNKETQSQEEDKLEEQKKSEDEAAKKAAEQQQTAQQSKSTVSNANQTTTNSSNISSEQSQQATKAQENTSVQQQVKPPVQAGVNEVLTNEVNSISSTNAFKITDRVSYFQDMANKISSGNISTASAKEILLGSQWEDSCNVNKGRAKYTVDQIVIDEFTSNLNTANELVSYALNNGKRTGGSYAINSIYTNSDGRNKYVRLSLVISPFIPAE